MKILLLEDNPLDADLVVRAIKNRWPHVDLQLANRLSDASNLLKDEQPFDIALFDLNLPDGNGIDLLVDLRSAYSNLPIIIFTSVGSEEIAIASLKAGANDYIPKRHGYQETIPDHIEFTLNHAFENIKHLQVLYVEHQKADIELTLHYLEKYTPHIHLEVVAMGELALSKLPANCGIESDYDVLLLDYQLPGLNALEIIKEVRQERKLFIPIVIVTGQGDETIAVEALKIGADDYVIKHNNYLMRLPSVLMSAYRHRELERQQQALKQSETKYRLLANHASEWEYWVNPQKEYIYNSPVCEKTSGYPIEAFLENKNLLTEITHPAHQEMVGHHFAQIKAELHEPIEFCIITADGKEKWISHFCKPVYDDEGNYLGQRGVNRDITDQKRAENIQNVILNISNAINVTTDLAESIQLIQQELGRVVDTSNFFVALYNEEQDMIHLPYYKDEKDDIVDFPAGKTITGLVIKQGKSLLLNEQAMNTLEASNEIEVIGETPKIWLGVPLKTKGKTIGAFVVQSYANENAYTENDKEVLEIISHQISSSIERKLHEEELVKALENAKESDRLKSAFLANMSHEIRTPMSGILGFSDLLKKPDLSLEKQQKYIEIIEKSGQRMLSTINDIMDISKIEAGLMKVSKSNVNISEKVEELFAFFKPEAAHKGLILRLKCNLEPEEINTDEQKLVSILTNLIKNAIKFTPSGSVEISCSKNKNLLEFCVKDTGIGIPSNRQAHIFDRFIQADIEDKAAHQGSGLGLAISKSYVEMLGGTIWLTSEEGTGSAFYFSIPLVNS